MRVDMLAFRNHLEQAFAGRSLASRSRLEWLLVGAILVLLLIAGLAFQVLDWLAPSTFSETTRLLDTLQEQTAVEVDEQPQVALHEASLTVELLRAELKKQDGAAFRQNLTFTVVSFVAGAAVSVAVQLWVGR